MLNLAIAHAAGFRALVALEAADFQQPWYDTAWLHRPDVHGGEVCAALISGLIAPQSPPVSRHETLWMYMQGGPGIFKGDLYFYRVDGDLREKVKSIDTNARPLYLLTGEYDFSCTAEDALRTAAQIPGAQVQVAKELGHFPMSENREVPRIHPAGAGEDRGAGVTKKSHDAYIAAAPEPFRALLEQLRAQLSRALPDAEEVVK